MELLYLPTWMVDSYGKLVGKYTSPMLCTLPFQRLKIDAWKMNLLSGWPIFRCELLVLGNVILVVVTIASWERATPEALPSTISIIYILILDSSFGPSAIIILHAMTHFPPDIKKTLTCQDTEDSSQRVYCRKGRDPGNILPFKIKLTTVGWPSTPVGVDSLSAYIIMQDWL